MRTRQEIIMEGEEKEGRQEGRKAGKNKELEFATDKNLSNI